MATAIKNKPKGGVSSLSVRRGDGYRVSASWKVPAALVNENSDSRATDLLIAWYLGVAGTDPKSVTTTTNEKATASSRNLDAFPVGSRTYTRASFFPVTSRRLSYVTCKVRAKNEKGYSADIPSATLTFRKPRKPSVAAYAVNAETGVISTTVTTDAGTDNCERYDTEYYWKVRNSTTKQVLRDVHGTTRSTSFSLSVNASGYQSLGGGYIECVCRARSRGLAGVSEWVERRYYLAYPKSPVIKRVDQPSGTTGTVVAYIATNRTTEHPVTRVRLEALVDVEYSTVAEAAGAVGEWEEVGGPDDGACTALAVNVADVRPTTAGRHSWLRVHSTAVIDDVLEAYSAPYELKKLYRPPYSATGDVVRILDAHAGEDGESAVVTLGWAPSGATDQSTGTELSWSEELDTWRSTDEPETFNVLYDDGAVTYDGVRYSHSATITIKGLEKGQTTYIRARRYHEGADATTYGEYCETATVTPATIPASVVLDVRGYVAAGEDLALTWTYDSDATQDAWRVMDGAGAVVAEAQSALGSTSIPAGRVASLAVDNTLSLSVAVSMGGAWVTSEPKQVIVIEPPTLSASTAATLELQPMRIGVACSSATAQLAIVVTAANVSGMTPDGLRVQAAGDVVWSGVVTPEWDEGEATVTLPEGLAFADGADYAVTVRATDLVTGMSSDAVGLATKVAWAHQAPDPDGCVTLTPVDEVDADGVSTKAVAIGLTPPGGSEPTDVYDVYRLTGDGAALIGQSLPLDASATDTHAPYGDGMELAYRVACRTADGDVQWADVPYRLGGAMIRIDWAGQYVELPYDITIDDGYAKRSNVVDSLDGSTDVNYNQGVRRTASLATDVLRLADPDTIAGVLALAHHAGTAFVRTPTGAAYEADVQVDSFAPTREVVAVSISATEVRLTDEYRLPPLAAAEEPEQTEG